ncbi:MULTISPECIES: ABC exporter membrane fusion protein [Pseudanabaena]|uniref:ABC exporter membrane fusion protein, DevB family n=2 Tax=Pseudanabaena TaxID=1152 RepID=L8N793_9CYAN|nr:MULTISPECIES: ABC exporter membrane fusion protein [Pseudanabaena]ELS34103.1 ABC exporter membrane fusion protein, DevB family [Pseudanabaena biceps PCC 7429]MDG3493692.1 ABC exporter membrane fusion protein [Pseudanabaena catenata USMAC16]
MLQSSSDGGSGIKSQRWLAAAVGVVVIGVVGYGVWRSQASPSAVSQTVIAPAKSNTVTALGRLEPQGEVIKLSANSTNSNRLEKLLVQEGDRVQVGQVIAILDSRDRLQAAYEQAQEDVRVAQSKLAITQAGAKQGEINAQRAEIVRLQAQRQGDVAAQAATVDRLNSELQNAELEFNRYQQLAREGAISNSTLDSKRLTLNTAQRNVQEAKAVLNRIQTTSPAQIYQAEANLARVAEVRAVDVEANQAEVDRAIAAMKQAKANLDQAYVKATIAGEILEIHTRAGEVVSDNGIVSIGKTQQMYAIAQVYQSDIQKVKPNQKVKILSDSIAGELLGKVERIDSQVKRQTIVNTDPSTNIDGRVVEVHVVLDRDSSQRAAKFTNLQVTMEIEQ